MAITYSVIDVSATQRHLNLNITVTGGAGYGFAYWVGVHGNGTSIKDFGTVQTNATTLLSFSMPAALYPQSYNLVLYCTNDWSIGWQGTIAIPADVIPNVPTITGLATNTKLDVTQPITFTCSGSGYDGPVQYDFYIAAVSGGTGYMTSYDNSSTSGTIGASTLQAGYTYTVQVRCKNSVGASAYSAPITFLTRSYTISYKSVGQRHASYQYNVIGGNGDVCYFKLNNVNISSATATSDNCTIFVYPSTTVPGVSATLTGTVSGVDVLSTTVDFLAEVAPPAASVTLDAGNTVTANTPIAFTSSVPTYDGPITMYRFSVYTVAAGVLTGMIFSRDSTTRYYTLPEGVPNMSSQYAVTVTCATGAGNFGVESAPTFFSSAAPAGPNGTYTVYENTASQRNWTHSVKISGGTGDTWTMYVNTVPIMTRYQTLGLDYIYFSTASAITPSTQYDMVVKVGTYTVYTGTTTTLADVTPNPVTIASPSAMSLFDSYTTSTITANTSSYDDPNMVYQFAICNAVPYYTPDANALVTLTSAAGNPTVTLSANSLTAGGGYYYYVRCKNSGTPSGSNTWSTWSAPIQVNTDSDQTLGTVTISTMEDGARFAPNTLINFYCSLDPNWTGTHMFYFEIYNGATLFRSSGGLWEQTSWQVNSAVFVANTVYTIRAKASLWSNKNSGDTEWSTPFSFSVAPEFIPNNFKLNNQPHRRM